MSEDNSLTSRFIAPPFSILDARKGYWRERKRKWRSQGVVPAVGRDDEIGISKSLRKRENTSSAFDPVLAELVYRWFLPDAEGCVVADPFCGGISRGLVAHSLGHHYSGFDIREEQIDANRNAVGNADIKSKSKLEYDIGDAREFSTSVGECDLVFSCPPYHDLEHYSDRDADLSNMAWGEFCNALGMSLERPVRRLRTAGSPFSLWEMSVPLTANIEISSVRQLTRSSLKALVFGTTPFSSLPTRPCQLAALAGLTILGS